MLNKKKNNNTNKMSTNIQKLPYPNNILLLIGSYWHNITKQNNWSTYKRAWRGDVLFKFSASCNREHITSEHQQQTEEDISMQIIMTRIHSDSIIP